MKIKTNNTVIDITDAETVTLDENVVFIQRGNCCDTLNINEAESIVSFRERHNDWEYEVVEHIIGLVADDFFSILENEYKQEKTINYEETIAELLHFYLPEESRVWN